MKTVKLSKLERDTKGLKFFPLFTLLGWELIMFAGILVLGLIVNPAGAAYWGGSSKAARDEVANFPKAGGFHRASQLLIIYK